MQSPTNQLRYFEYLEDKGLVATVASLKELRGLPEFDIEIELVCELSRLTVDYVALEKLDCNDPIVLDKVIRMVLLANNAIN